MVQTVTTGETARSRREREMKEFSTDESLLRELRDRMKNRIHRVRKTTGYESLPDSLVTELLPSAVALGFARVLYTKFAAAQGFGRTWWLERRRELTGSARGRGADANIASVHFGEALLNYYPPEPVTQEEVLKMAAMEFRDMVASGGTDYHQIEAQERIIREERDKGEARGMGLYDTASGLSQSGRSGYTGAWEDRVVAFDTREVPRHYLGADANSPGYSEFDIAEELPADIITAFSLRRYNEDHSFVLGRVTTVIYRKCCQEIGPRQALQWLFWKLEFEETRSYEELLRIFGDTEEVLGRQAFKSRAVTLSRKLDWMDGHLIPRLQEDEELQELRDLLLDQFGSVERDPVTSVEPSSPPNPVLKESRLRFARRRRAEMLRRVEEDPETQPLKTWVEEYEEEHPDTEISPLLSTYITLRHAWERFKKHLMKASSAS